MSNARKQKQIPIASLPMDGMTDMKPNAMIGDKTIAVIAAVIAVAVWIWNVYYYGS